MARDFNVKYYSISLGEGLEKTASQLIIDSAKAVKNVLIVYLRFKNSVWYLLLLILKDFLFCNVSFKLKFCFQKLTYSLKNNMNASIVFWDYKF